jgi:hypothetical protein
LTCERAGAGGLHCFASTRKHYQNTCENESESMLWFHMTGIVSFPDTTRQDLHLRGKGIRCKKDRIRSRRRSWSRYRHQFPRRRGRIGGSAIGNGSCHLAA